MKKSNIVIFALALLASAFLIWLWYYLGFDKVDNPLDIAASGAWWAIIAVAIFAITKLENKRKEGIRTCYVDSMAIFNPERGSVPSAGTPAVEAIQGILEKLEYGFGIQEDPAAADASHKYRFVVRSKAFKTETVEGEVQVKEWSGEVADPSEPGKEPLPFTSKEELANILAA